MIVFYYMLQYKAMDKDYSVMKEDLRKMQDWLDSGMELVRDSEHLVMKLFLYSRKCIYDHENILKIDNNLWHWYTQY